MRGRASYACCNSSSRAGSRIRTAPPGQLDHPLALEVPEHPGDHLTVGAQMVGYGLVGELQLLRSLNMGFLQQKRRNTLVQALHMICSMSHMTSEKREAISSLV